MPEEKPELPISPQEVQIQAPSLLDKIKIHKFKILGGVLGVLVFAGAVFGAYKLGQKQVQPGPGPTPTPEAVATPTPDLTINWKTYTNTKYKFSFKFPPDWIEAGYVEDDFRAFKQVASKNLEEKGVIPYDYILVSAGLLKKVNQEGFWNKQADETYFNYLYSQKIGEKRKGDPRYTITKLEELLINGAKAVKQAEEVAPEAETEYFYTVSVYILKNGQVFEFSGRFPNQDTWIKTENTFNLMFSTFKFLEEKASIESREECESAGGKWTFHRAHPLDSKFAYCILPTSDAGQTCASTSQCESGLCVVKALNSTSGTCYEWSSAIGWCGFALVENNKVKSYCID